MKTKTKKREWGRWCKWMGQCLKYLQIFGKDAEILRWTENDKQKSETIRDENQRDGMHKCYNSRQQQIDTQQQCTSDADEK